MRKLLLLSMIIISSCSKGDDNIVFEKTNNEFILSAEQQFITGVGVYKKDAPQKIFLKADVSGNEDFRGWYKIVNKEGNYPTRIELKANEVDTIFLNVDNPLLIEDRNDTQFFAAKKTIANVSVKGEYTPQVLHNTTFDNNLSNMFSFNKADYIKISSNYTLIKDGILISNNTLELPVKIENNSNRSFVVGDTIDVVTYIGNASFVGYNGDMVEIQQNKKSLYEEAGRRNRKDATKGNQTGHYNPIWKVKSDKNAIWEKRYIIEDEDKKIPYNFVSNTTNIIAETTGVRQLDQSTASVLKDVIKRNSKATQFVGDKPQLTMKNQSNINIVINKITTRYVIEDEYCEILINNIGIVEKAPYEYHKEANYNYLKYY